MRQRLKAERLDQEDAVKQKRHSRKFDNVESASFQLAFLKENSRYRKFIEENRGRVLSAYREWRSAVLDGRAPKIPSVNRLGEEIPLADMFKLLVEAVAYTHVWFHKRLEEDFGIVKPPFDVFTRSADSRHDVLTADESFDLLDPMKDIETVPKERREAAIRGMFSACGIRHVVHNDEEALLRRMLPGLGITQTVHNHEEYGEVPEEASISVFELEQREKQQRSYEAITSGGVSPWFKDKLVPFPLSGLLPHERLLVVDLRKKKSELREEFGAYLDGIKFHRENTKDPEWKRSYSRWKLDTKRSREQAWRHLKVWQMVTHRGMKFKEIASELKIRVDAAEFSFKQAHKLTQGFPCPPGELANLRNVVKSALPVICDTCDKRETCTEECDEIKRYVGYGERRFTRERVVSQIVRHDKESEGEDENTPEDSLRTDIRDGRVRRKKMAVADVSTGLDLCGNPIKRREAPLPLTPEEKKKRLRWVRETTKEDDIPHD